MTGTVLHLHPAHSPIVPNQRGFSSFKCVAPIEYTQRCSRDALIQASLEPCITAIESLSGAYDDRAGVYFAFAALIQDRRCAIALTNDNTTSNIPVPAGCEQVIPISRTQILADPVKTTTRTIWSHRETNVPPLFSVRVMRHLRDKPEGLRLGDLEEDLGGETGNWVKYTLAMACGGLLSVDFRSPISDQTAVRINPERPSYARPLWSG